MGENNRQEARLESIQTIFIEVHSTYPNTAENCRMVICNSLDISANGIRAQIDCELPVGAIYQLCVEFNEPPYRILLAAEVKWLRPAADEDEYEIGLAIFESDDTDIAEWKLLIADALEG